MPARRSTCRCTDSFTCGVCLSGNPDWYAHRATLLESNPEIDAISEAIQRRAEGKEK